MAEQLALFPEAADRKPRTDRERRNWENRFQRWSDSEAQKGDNPLGCCGCGAICDYCDDNTYGRPCVRALNAMCRETNTTIDYKKQAFESAWEGVFDG